MPNPTATMMLKNIDVATISKIIEYSETLTTFHVAISQSYKK
ncbi:Uncharacterised protein [Legionella sainthelensi]|nr:Uncharacterised protein [Legionella sainthelensi]